MDLFSHYLLIFICFLNLNIYFTEVIPVLFRIRIPHPTFPRAPKSHVK